MTARAPAMDLQNGSNPTRASGERRHLERDSFARRAGAFVFYVSTVLLIFAGWAYRDLHLIAPEFGLGYWLGIAGTTLMALLFLYPVRKRVRAFRKLGRVSTWFRVHMAFGIVGPTLVIFHSNFQLGSFNSRVALISMLVVAGSGLFGRYFYSRVHYGLSGRHATLESLRDDFGSLESSRTALSRVLPDVVAELRRVEEPLLVPHLGLGEAFGAALRAGVMTRWAAFRARSILHRALKEEAATSAVVRRERGRLARNAGRYVELRMRALRKYAQFSLFERLLSLWHVVHYPLFVALVISAIVHIVAVHLY